MTALPAPREVPEICSCVWIRDSRGYETARLCPTHYQEWHRCRQNFMRWPCEERWFDTRADAQDYARIVRESHPGPGYQVRADVYPIAGRYVTFGHYFSTE